MIIKISKHTGYKLWSSLVYVCVMLLAVLVWRECVMWSWLVYVCPVVSCTCVEGMCYVELASVCVSCC